MSLELYQQGVLSYTRPPIEEGILENQQRSILESPYDVVDEGEASALRERKERGRREREKAAVKQPVFTEEEVSV